MNECPTPPASVSVLAAIASVVSSPLPATDRTATDDTDAPRRHGDWASPASSGRRFVASPLPNDRIARLLAEMRAGDERAWSTFLSAFRPVLVEYARRTRIPRELWDACVDEVLADESCRIVAAAQPAPPDVTAYFLRAARNKFLNQRRAAIRRQRRYEQAADGTSSDGVIMTVCSAYVRHVSDGGSLGAQEAVVSRPTTADAPAPPGAVVRADEPEGPVSDGVRSVVLERVQHALVAATTGEERTVLTWLADGFSHRQIGAWLGITRAAAAKRAWRIRQRLRNVAIREVETLARQEHVSAAAALRVLTAFGGEIPCLAD